MPMKRLALAGFALPMTLALAACGSEEAEDGAVVAGETVAPIAAPEGQEWVNVAAETPEGGYRIGNPEAPLQLVEYASHTCPHCADFAAQATPEIEEYVRTGAVSYEIRNQIHDPLDLTIALLARCGSPETFHPIAGQLWANLEQIITTVQGNTQALEQAIQAPPEQRYQQIAEAAGLIDFVAARGISRDQAMQCLARPEIAQQIAERSQTQSQELNVTGTPTFFLNGERLEVGTWETLEPVLQEAGAPAI